MRHPLPGARNLLQRVMPLWPSNDGAVAITAAVFFMVAIGATAFAVDIGALYLERRQAQGIADLAALAAASDLERAQAAATATLHANGIDNAKTIVVETGRYEDRQDLAPADRFKPGGTPVNAARVSVTKPGRLYFAQAFTQTCCEMQVTALATRRQAATFSLGSGLLRVREGVANLVLGRLLGGNVTLSGMDYTALAAADVSLVDFSNALATRLSLTGVTYDELLRGSASVGDILNALLSVNERNGNTLASGALRLLLTETSANARTVRLSSLLDFDSTRLENEVVGTPVPGMLRVMDIVSGAATLANGNTMVSVDLGANVPGVLSTKVDIAIGEPPQHSSWAAVGEPGAMVRTAQTRVRIVAEIGGSGILAGTRLRLPLYLDLAYARGRLARIACADNGNGTVTVGATPGIAAAAIGEVSNSDFSDFSADAPVSKATIAQAVLKLLLLQVDLKVKGRAELEAGNTGETLLTFASSEIGNNTVKRTSTSTLAESLVTSLLGRLALDVELSSLAITTPSAVTTVVGDLLRGVAGPLDDTVFSVLEMLGVHLGEADVRVHGVSCRSAVLAG